MHVSLDSALGRQRRLNSVGESVLQIAPSAAAAYSLRSLTGGDPEVVYVRRGTTDNAERKFTVSEINSGYLVNWVNRGNGVFQNTGYESFTNASATGFTASNTASSGFAISDIADGVSGDVVKVSFDITITNGSPKLSLRGSMDGGSQASNAITYTSSGSKTATLTANDNYVGVGFPEGDVPSNFTVSNFKVLGNGFVDTWYDQSGNNRPLIQTTASEQPLIVEAGVFLDGVKSDQATSNDTMQNLQVSTDGTNANFGTDDWASGASLKLGAVYVGTVPTDSVATSTANSIIWGGGRGVGSFQGGGVSLTVIKSGTDSWRIRNERQGLSPSTMDKGQSLNTDADVVLYGTTDNREFTINVNGSGGTSTESADLDVREGQALSLFGAYNGTDGRYYQRSSGGVCKECYLYAGDSVANIPALATSINSHYSIY